MTKSCAVLPLVHPKLSCVVLDMGRYTASHKPACRASIDDGDTLHSRSCRVDIIARKEG